MPVSRAACFLSLLLACAEADVLVTGGTGRLGSLIYQQLKKDGKLGQVRALVRDASKAKDTLGCNACDESDGIFVGDVTNTDSLSKAMTGVTHLAIATGVHGNEDEDTVKSVEFLGVKNQVAALLQGGVENKHVMMISSMSTTWKAQKDIVLFYKLNAEAFVESSGVSFSIIKPCGLADGEAGQAELLAGHDDEGKDAWFPNGWYMIPRADVAAVAARALESAPADEVRFDICSKPGNPTDPDELLRSSLYPWQQSAQVVV